MKSHIAITVLALAAASGAAFAQMSSDGSNDPRTSTGQTANAAAPERSSLPHGSYGLINDPAVNTYYFAP